MQCNGSYSIAEVLSRGPNYGVCKVLKTLRSHVPNLIQPPKDKSDLNTIPTDTIPTDAVYTSIGLDRHDRSFGSFYLEENCVYFI